MRTFPVVTLHPRFPFSVRLTGKTFDSDAKLAVSKFSIGFGPNLLSYQGPEVEYSLRAIPLGGFVAFPDDDPDCPFPEDDPDLLRNRPMKDRAIVVSAGVLANVAFALAILTTQVNTVGFR